MKKDKNSLNQLQEIAKVIKSFELESVQLKLVDVLLKDFSIETESGKENVQKKVAEPIKPAVKQEVKKEQKRPGRPAVIKAVEPVKAATKKIEKKSTPVKSIAVKPVTQDTSVNDAKKGSKKVSPKAAVPAKVKAPKAAKAEVKAAIPASKAKVKKIKTKENGVKPTKNGGGPGVSKTINQLFAEGFFKTNRSMVDVLNHCNNTMKLSFKMTDLSGIMSKLVKDKKLDREKNPKTHKFEYLNA